MLPCSFVVKTGSLDAPARREGSGVHDEGHREGGPGIRYQNAFFRLAQKENATATPFVRGVITGAIERRALLSAPGAR